MRNVFLRAQQMTAEISGFIRPDIISIRTFVTFMTAIIFRTTFMT